jgi:hypothetical protein
MIKILLVILLVILVAWFIFRKKEVNISDFNGEPNVINVFPDYPKDLPLQASLGDKLNFICKGYCDKYKMQEVTLFEKEIEWQHQNYVGNFLGETSDIIQGGINVQYVIPTGKEHIGKLLYVTARYHGLQDTTWIKIGG